MIELMIAMVLGLLLTAGLLTLLYSVRQASATQNALARLQENGRAAIDTMAADFRNAGHLPCGSHESPLVYAEALNSHLLPPLPLAVGAGAAPYPLDKSIFILGNTCEVGGCTPVADATLPPTGLKDGQRLPGTDVVTTRYLDGEGVELGENVSCATSAVVQRIALRRPLTGDQKNAFASHLGMLANCKSASVVPVAIDNDAIQVRATMRGAPACASVDQQTRLFDFDVQMRTITYFLRVDKRATGQLGASLIRRVNGIDNEVVDGVERMNIRYSFTDSTGMTHWVLASEMESNPSAGARRQCGTNETGHPCGWADVVAVDISILVNTVDELPADSPAVTNMFRYSPDGKAMQSPSTEMPVTGLPVRRLLRREFHTVVALRNIAA